MIWVILVAVLLALPAQAQDCGLPADIVIVSDDPCRTWIHAQVSFEKARARWWTTHRALDPIFGFAEETWSRYSNPRIQELAGWKIIEHPTSFYREGSRLDGLIHVGDRTIEFARDSHLWPLAHEFAHWIGYAKPIPYGTLWQYAGHGGLFGVGALDTFVFALWAQMCNTLFDPFCEMTTPHQYSPQSLFEGKIRAFPDASWCVVNE